MDNKETLQTYNTRLDNNNGDLNTILETINNLPSGSGASTPKFGELCLDYTVEEDKTGTTNIPFDNSKVYNEIFIVVDESNNESGTYTGGLRVGVLNETHSTNVLGNVASKWVNSRKWKTMHIETFTEYISRYTVTGEIQLWGYVSSDFGVGQIQTSTPFNGYGGVSFYGTLLKGMNIKVYGK